MTTVIKSAHTGRYLYAIVYEEFVPGHWVKGSYVRGEWKSCEPKYIYAMSRGEAQWFFSQGQKLETNILEIGLAVGFFDTGKRKLVHHCGIRADEMLPVLTA